jgi:hypothetical protein
MDLKKEVHRFLNAMSNERTFFFNSSKSESLLVGSIRGQLVCILVIESNRKLSLQEINFNSKIVRAHGLHFTVRSMEDVSELAKIKGWIDD